MTKFKGLLSRKLTFDSTQAEISPDVGSSVTRNQMYINYATESNCNGGESRSVSTANGKSHKFTLWKKRRRNSQREGLKVKV